MRHRHLSANEIAIISLLLSKKREAAESFLRRRAELQCIDLDEYGSISFCAGIPIFNVELNGPVGDGVMPNHPEGLQDGTRINFILFAKGKELSELQIYTDDGCAIDVNIDADRIELT